jgi:hypothetical protein
MSANENSNTGIIHLVKFVWASATYRYITDAGFVSYLSETWIEGNDTQGTIIGLSAYTEKGGELTNRDITIAGGENIETWCIQGLWQGVLVYIYEANRDPETGTLSVLSSSVWEIGDYNADSGLMPSIQFILKPHELASALERNQGFTISSKSQAALMPSITDNGLDLVIDKK